VPDPTPETPTVVVDLTTGQAKGAIEDLMEAAGSTRVINVEISRYEAKLAVVTGFGATTYAWRSGQVQVIDSDTAYVGQAIFDPRQTWPDDIASLWEKAAQVSGSDTEQKLQMVDYDQGAVYICITTNPESIPVFFTPTGRLVRALDPASVLDLAAALNEVAPDGPVVRIGISPQGGVWAEVEGGSGQVWRSTRDRQFPVRHQMRADSGGLESFDPDPVSAYGVLTAVDAVGAQLGLQDSTWSVEVRVDKGEPCLFVTMGARTVRASLAGVILE
jgi:hypothetical protein